MKLHRLLLTSLLAATISGSAIATTIDFEAASPGSLTNFYSGSGVTFSNATVGTYSLAGMSGSHAIYSSSSGTFFTASNAVVATFSSGMGSVSITGIDLGGNGLRIDAYDSAVGGSLVDFDTVFGSGAGVGNFATVSATSAMILRVEMYQVLSTFGDGIVLDDLTFSTSTSSVPDNAATLPLLLTSLAGMVAYRRNRR